MNPAFAHVDCWVFDLDNTLYPATGPIWDSIGQRMTAYVMRATGLPQPEAYALQERYLLDHGATMVGLVEHHAVDPHHFLADVHDIDFSIVAEDHELRDLLNALPGQRLVYTNGAEKYARSVLTRMGVADAFDDVFAIDNADLFPKPRRESFDRLIARYAIDPARAVMVEDTPRNLVPAHELGFKTVLIHPEPSADWPEHIHHATDCVKAFLRGVLT